MTRVNITPNVELLIAERSLGGAAVVLGLAAGLSLFFWLNARRGARSWAGRVGMLVAALAAGVLAVGGLIEVAGLIHPVFGWACAGLALVGLVAVSYFRGAGRTAEGGAGEMGLRGRGARRAGWGRTWVLLALRLLAIGVLVGLYFEPTLKLVNRSMKRSKLLVLVDASGSMKTNDGPNRVTRLDWAKSELGGRHGALAKLSEDFEVELYSFSDSLAPIAEKGLPGLGPTGPATALAATVGEACAKCDKLSVAGALVFTDGIDNSGHDPVAEIAQAGLPVFPVAVGSKLRETGEFKDIAVTRVDCERFIAAENKTEVTAHIEAVGLKGRRVPVVLRFDGKEKDRQTLVLDDLAGTQAVKLSFTPDRKGEFKCAVEAPADAEERITDNNVREFDVVVTEPSIKVLLVEGVIRSEYKYLLRTLQMDPNVSLLALVQVSRGTFKQQGNVKDVNLTGFPADYETLKKFNVVMFGDIDRTAFTTEQLGNVQKMVESGGGFLMMGGYSSLGPGGYGGTAIEEILPVQLGGKEMGQEKDQFVPQLTPEGTGHPIFSGIAQAFGAGEGGAKDLPALLGLTRVGGAKAGATVVAVHPGRAGADGRPLIVAAVQRYGSGRTMVFTADTTWRWYLGLRGVGRDTPYVKFWGQTLRWLAGQEVKEMEAKPGVIAYTERRSYEPGATVHIYTQVRDQQGQATSQATVTALIRGPTGPPGSRQIPYLMGSAGKYEVDFEPPSPGEYKMEVKAETLQGVLGAAQVAFRVGRPNLEFDVLDLNDELLKRLAERTKGKYVTLVGLSGFVERLRGAEQAKSTITTVNVWGDGSLRVLGESVSPYLLVAFVVFSGLVTAEWVLRKRKQLI